MIVIKEISPPRKISGLSSLLIDCGGYNAATLNVIRTFSPAVYNNTDHTGEVSIIYLAKLLDQLTFIDDIRLELLPDEIREISSEQLTEDGLKKFISQK